MSMRARYVAQFHNLSHLVAVTSITTAYSLAAMAAAGALPVAMCTLALANMYTCTVSAMQLLATVAAVCAAATRSALAAVKAACAMDAVCRRRGSALVMYDDVRHLRPAYSQAAHTQLQRHCNGGVRSCDALARLVRDGAWPAMHSHLQHLKTNAQS
jgi:hypothetical protein